MADFKVTQLESDLDFSNLPYWDVVIIGAGPAGLAASLTTAHWALTTLVIEAKDRPGGQPQFLYADKRIVDIPGFPDGISGEELSQRTYRQAVDALVQFRFNEELVTIEDTDQLETGDRLKRVMTTKSSYLCRKVIIACGLLHYPRRLGVLDQLESKNVHYKVPKIGDYEGSRVAVVGGGDSALDAALMVQARGGLVDLVVREAAPIGKADSLDRIREAGGHIHTSTEITSAGFEGNEIELELMGVSRVVAGLPTEPHGATEGLPLPSAASTGQGKRRPAVGRLCGVRRPAHNTALFAGNRADRIPVGEGDVRAARDHVE